MKRFFKWFGIIVGILFLLSIFDLFPIAEPVFILLFGWIFGIYHLVSGLQHEPVAVLTGLASLTLLPMFMHLFLRRLPTPVFQTWRFRQSVAVVGIACAFMITTIALIALIHEVYWIAHPAEPMSINF